jgi:hypothetical protein
MVRVLKWVGVFILAAVAMMLAMIASVAVMAGAATAQGMPCGEAETVLSSLGRDYDEVAFLELTAARGQPVILMAEPGGGTWTIVVLDGTQACLVASGESWRSAAPASPTPEGELN